MIVSMHLSGRKFFQTLTAGKLHNNYGSLGDNDVCMCRYCSSCKCHRSAEKKLDLWRLSTILVIHLKRFSFNGPFRDKLETPVDFPIRGLDLTPYIASSSEKKPAIYDLYAITVRNIVYHLSLHH